MRFLRGASGLVVAAGVGALLLAGTLTGAVEAIGGPAGVAATAAGASATPSPEPRPGRGGDVPGPPAPGARSGAAGEPFAAGAVVPRGWDPATESAKWAAVAEQVKSGSTAAPEPRVVEEFAGDLSGEHRRIPKAPQPPVAVPADVDGCNRAYGNVTQCIPAQLPPGESDMCMYLANRHIPPVRVNGADPAGADPDGNGMACD